MRTAITLRDCLTAGLTHLTIECSRCDRRGRLSLARLVRERGPDASTGDVMDDLGADCPKRDALQPWERCDRFCRDLLVVEGLRDRAKAALKPD
jgi:hypothetical protein